MARFVVVTNQLSSPCPSPGSPTVGMSGCCSTSPRSAGDGSWPRHERRRGNGVHGGVRGPRRSPWRHTTTERGATVVPCGVTLASPGTHGPTSWSSNVIGAQPALTITYRPPADHASAASRSMCRARSQRRRTESCRRMRPTQLQQLAHVVVELRPLLETTPIDPGHFAVDVVGVVVTVLGAGELVAHHEHRRACGEQQDGEVVLRVIAAVAARRRNPTSDGDRW